MVIELKKFNASNKKSNKEISTKSSSASIVQINDLQKKRLSRQAAEELAARANKLGW